MITFKLTKLHRLTSRLILLAGLMSLSIGANATAVYKWLDEGGQVHFSNVVPEQYKSIATKVESKLAEVSSTPPLKVRKHASKYKKQLSQTLKSTHTNGQG